MATWQSRGRRTEGHRQRRGASLDVSFPGLVMSSPIRLHVHATSDGHSMQVVQGKRQCDVRQLKRLPADWLSLPCKISMCSTMAPWHRRTVDGARTLRPFAFGKGSSVALCHYLGSSSGRRRLTQLCGGARVDLKVNRKFTDFLNRNA